MFKTYSEIERENRAIKELKRINEKNKTTEEFSLGDVLLLQKFENDLKSLGYPKVSIILFSNSYYGK